MFRMGMIALAIPALIAAGAGTAQASGDLYGAIAEHSDNGIHGASGFGVAVDYPTQEAANQAAIEACQQRNSRCTVVLSIQNECGAAVQGLIQGNILVNNEVRPIYWFGKGPTATAAQQSALDGANRILTNNPVMNAGSGQIVQAPTVLDTICTSNAG